MVLNNFTGRKDNFFIKMAFFFSLKLFNVFFFDRYKTHSGATTIVQLKTCPPVGGFIIHNC